MPREIPIMTVSVQTAGNSGRLDVVIGIRAKDELMTLNFSEPRCEYWKVLRWVRAGRNR